MSDAPSDPFGLVGTVLVGQYRVDRVVAEGGFGVVYKGWHLSFDQPIALKVLKVPHAFDEATQQGVLAKFREEAKLYYVLSQASLNIVRAVAFGEADTPSGIWAPYVVLEWLEGRSLAADLDDRRQRGLQGRSLGETMSLLEPAAKGLSYVHGKRVAHRDVKPGNLFLTTLPGDPPQATVKLLDFGIAKEVAEGAVAGTAPSKATAFSSFTPFYAAPEQFDPRLGATGPWTDVYAFALVMTEVLTDRPVFAEEDAITLIARATDAANRPTPRARGAQVPDAVEAAFLRALAIDPKVRFHDVGAFWEALTGAARLALPTPAPLSPQGKLPTTTTRMQPRQPYDTAPMASVPAKSTNVTAPMRSVPQRRAGSSPALQTPPPMSVQSWPTPNPAGFVPPRLPGTANPATVPAPGVVRPSNNATLVGCLVGVALLLTVLAVLGVRIAACIAK